MLPSALRWIPAMGSASPVSTVMLPSAFCFDADEEEAPSSVWVWPLSWLTLLVTLPSAHSIWPSAYHLEPSSSTT